MRALFQSGVAITDWLPRRMSMGGRGIPPKDIGSLQPGNPHFEFPATPPRDFLRWLVLHPDRLVPPKYETAVATVQKRAALLARDPATVRMALDAIDNPGLSHERRWWCFEGTTMVDCAIITNRLAIFIEGKRTEVGPSSGVSWYPSRNQVVRNLDCARWYALEHDLDYYSMLVIEQCEQGDERWSHAEAVSSWKVMRASLPHLSEEQVREAGRHNLGWTTWQRIASEFGLPDALLPRVGFDAE